MPLRIIFRRTHIHDIHRFPLFKPSFQFDWSRGKGQLVLNYFFAFEALEILSLVVMVVLLFDTSFLQRRAHRDGVVQ